MQGNILIRYLCPLGLMGRQVNPCVICQSVKKFWRWNTHFLYQPLSKLPQQPSKTQIMRICFFQEKLKNKMEPLRIQEMTWRVSPECWGCLSGSFLRWIINTSVPGPVMMIPITPSTSLPIHITTATSILTTLVMKIILMTSQGQNHWRDCWRRCWGQISSNLGSSLCSWCWVACSASSSSPAV